MTKHRMPSSRQIGSRAMAGRLSWGLADQAVSSLTNFAVGIYVARTLGLEGFGIFSLAWVTYGVVLNISRGLATDPLVVRFSGVAVRPWRRATERASGTALQVGLIGGAVCVLAGFAIGGTLGSGFLALGIILPALLLQDSWRYAFFAAGRGRAAFVNDLVWGVALMPAMVLAAQHGSVSAFLFAWGASAAVAAAYGCLQTGLFPHWNGVLSWLRTHRDLGARYMVENVGVSGASQIRMYGLGAIAGLADVGTVRGAELLLGPFVAVLMGVGMAAVPEAARVLRRAPGKLRAFCALLGGLQALGVLLWGLVLLLLLSDELGTFVLGPVWIPASALIVPATLGVTNVSLCNGAAAGLRALGSARRSMRCQLLASAAYIGGGLGGAAAGGAVGSAWGVAAATAFAVVVWWLQLRAALREHLAEPATVPVTAPVTAQVAEPVPAPVNPVTPVKLEEVRSV